MTPPRIVQTRQPVRATTPTTGVLGRPDWRPFTLERYVPCDALAWCVEHYWQVEWDLPPGRSARSEVLPNPSINVAHFDDSLRVSGVEQGVFSYPLSGRGRVFGIKFRPGGFRPFVDFPVDRLTGRMVAAAELWSSAHELEGGLHAASAAKESIEVAEQFLLGLEVPVDPVTPIVDSAVRRLLTDPEVRRVSDVCDAGVSQRTLQRLFRTHVGVPPRWVLQRGRLHHAAHVVTEQAASDADGSWASLAVELGYVDQAHFIRDFRRVMGVTPARYAEQLRAQGSA